eukprot:scaffold41836_cov137-Amphora_coffeaeformis.AAC.1
MAFKVFPVLLWLGLMVATTPAVSSFMLPSSSSSSSSSSSWRRTSRSRASSELMAAAFDDASSSSSSSPPPPAPAVPDTPVLCELQTFLRLVDAVPTGGMAKTVIQAGQCRLNGQIETRRAKKVYAGDVVQLIDRTEGDDDESQVYDVAQHVALSGYVYQPKVKKMKPTARVIDNNGTLEFGGRYRSEDWRRERKDKKAERKRNNSTTKQREQPKRAD